MPEHSVFNVTRVAYNVDIPLKLFSDSYCYCGCYVCRFLYFLLTVSDAIAVSSAGFLLLRRLLFLMLFLFLLLA